ncbi:MAG TPA: hypothetical protein VH044_14505 [Polyangiaceae bacterium]|nr:hypothetical protein [Polyangiaceae bacterium]
MAICSSTGAGWAGNEGAVEGGGGWAVPLAISCATLGDALATGTGSAGSVNEVQLDSPAMVSTMAMPVASAAAAPGR